MTGPLRRLPVERLVAGGLLLLGLLLLSRLAGRSLAADILGLLLAIVGGGWLLAALRRARLTAPAPAPGASAAAGIGPGADLPVPAGPVGSGITAVREGAIGYFGPAAGAILARDTLTQVSVVTRPGADAGAAWRLEDSAGEAVEIPVEALGAEALLDTLVTLPGFDSAAARDALAGRRARPVTVWQRRPGADGARLGTRRPGTTAT